MFKAADPCRETVSALHALIFGADGACVALSLWSAFTLLLPFAAAVFLVQKLANLLIFGRRDEAPAGPGPHRPEDRTRTGQRMARHLRETADPGAAAGKPGH